ncbi:hypothetical protein KIW84_015358 [Lathyrus oleraceus]|uniref:Uncharacterized protein n=1 Tax=Pisum sativum TaxID=3888 RepID=A0A9D5BQE0_PEA|nr:hypothetical protein KIW84_015358 [Pisum sativum]
MWFNWHESLWACFPDFDKNFSNIEGFDNNSISLPQMLIQPVCASTVLQITKSSHAIKDFWVQCLKCRVSLSNLWNCSHHGEYFPKFLLPGARALFQQIIYAHRKSFDADQYAEIKFNFSSFEGNMATEESIQLVSTLVASSRHRGLKNSVNKFVVPLLRELYLQSTTYDFNFNYIISCAWAHIRALRIHLLLSYNEVDPAMQHLLPYRTNAQPKRNGSCNHNFNMTNYSTNPDDSAAGTATAETTTFRRREQNPVAPPEDVAGLNQNNVKGVDLGGDNREEES